jgi:acetolactate synthase-1/2/3 large subunit
MNNTVLGMVHQWQGVFYGERYSSSEPDRKTDYVKVIEGFGGKGYRCSNLAEFQKAFAEALQQQGPVWIDCRIAKEENVYPMIPAGATVHEAICR